jgi:hypothetical protein
MSKRAMRPQEAVRRKRRGGMSRWIATIFINTPAQYTQGKDDIERLSSSHPLHSNTIKPELDQLYS